MINRNLPWMTLSAWNGAINYDYWQPGADVVYIFQILRMTDIGLMWDGSLEQ